MTAKKKILIIGQTPPPYGGQAINIEKMIVVLKENDFNFRFIRMDFSSELSESGKVAFIKIWRLVRILINVLSKLFFYRPDYVYYPVSGAEKVPILRDIVLLFPVRLLKKKVIYHFHAGGLSEIFPLLHGFLKKLYSYVYFNADYAICMSEYGKKDPLFLNAKKIHIFPNGVKVPIQLKFNKADDDFWVLFVGVCRESKGILDYVKIIELANRVNNKIKGIVVGTIFGELEKSAIERGSNLGFIKYLGVKRGIEKEQIFFESSLFLFPTFFEHENFPTVNLEAFAHKIPVISTKWRGIVDQIKDGFNGYIHDVHDIDGMVSSILKIFNDETLMNKLSKNAYESFLDNYTEELCAESVLKFFVNLN